MSKKTRNKTEAQIIPWHSVTLEEFQNIMDHENLQPTRFTTFKLNNVETYVVAVKDKTTFYWSQAVSLTEHPHLEEKKRKLQQLTTDFLVDILARRNLGKQNEVTEQKNEQKNEQ